MNKNNKTGYSYTVKKNINVFIFYFKYNNKVQREANKQALTKNMKIS